MTEADREDFARAMMPLASNFRVDMSSAHFEAFWLALEDLSIGDVKAGVRRALVTCERMPAAAELRKLCGAMTPEMRAIRAFDAVRTAVHRAGSYRSVNFSDPAINAAIRSLGGWEKLCCTESGDEFDKWLRKDFERCYLEYVGNGVTAEQGAYLPGILEKEAYANGYPADPPRQIAVDIEPARMIGPVRARPSVGPDASGRIRGLINDAVKE